MHFAVSPVVVMIGTPNYRVINILLTHADAIWERGRKGIGKHSSGELQAHLDAYHYVRSGRITARPRGFPTTTPSHSHFGERRPVRAARERTPFNHLIARKLSVRIEEVPSSG